MTDDFDPFAGPVILLTAPSTEPQREIWTAAQAEPAASLSYNESITLVLRGAVDEAALKRAFSQLVARHEALRTTFSGDGLTLCVSAPQPVECSVLELSQLAPGELEAQLAELTRAHVETPFDLASGPLYRLTLVRVAADELRAVLTAHHIVCDGWATAVLLKDWAALYNAERERTNPQLPAPTAFSTFARERAAAADGEQANQDQRYWLQQFAGPLPVLELPYDRTRPQLKTFDARRCDVTLDGELLVALKKTAGKLRANLFTTLLSAFKTLLFRLSHESELVVGIPAAGQALGGFDNLVGHCVNMLPIRSRVTGNAPFSELLSQLRTTMLDAYEHQQYTFGTLLSKLAIPRDPSRLPLVSVVFNVDRGLTSKDIGFRGLEAQCLTNPRHYENFDLFLNAVELPDRMVLECQYNTDLFDELTIRRWLAAYEQLLRAVVADPSQPVAALPMLSSEERTLLVSWNEAVNKDEPLPACVHQLIEKVAARQSEAIACEFEGRSLNYGELNRSANQLARRLRSLGVTGGSLVGLCVDRSLDMLVGILGILKAGAAYVPLDPDYPAERLAFMAQDANLQVLVTQEAHRALLPGEQIQRVLLDADRASLAEESTEDLAHSSASATADTTAYVIYTSGSTGRPKGVLVPHGALVNLLNSVRKQPGMQASDVVLAVTTLAFDISTSELILPLTVGAKILLVSREVASDGVRLRAAMNAGKVSFIDATPATYRLLLAAGWTGDEALTAICTGEAMPRDLAGVLVELVGSLWNGYGPTETTVWSTFYKVPRPAGRVLIGRPVDNTRIYVLDENRQLVPIGVRGELYIGGRGVATGYLNRPDLTAERFLADPFVSTPGARMYRTGDVVRYLPNGELECLGRNDHQVKLRGYRIELGEIEDALGHHAAVQQSAVIVREDKPGEQRLIGYLVEQGASTTDAELRAHLKQSLPDYMVPAVYVRLASMPLTASGKIDRKALPKPDAQGPAREQFVAPSTPTQHLLAQLWQEVLSVPRVSVDDDFFALGGHSLLASQLLARLRTEHAIQVSFRKIFEAPTITALAAFIDQQAPAQPDAAPNPLLQPIAQRVPGQPLPLSRAQERIWLLEEMDPTQELVHVLPAAWRFQGSLQLPLLQRALDTVVQRHEPLRTTIQLVDGSAAQVVAETLSLPIVEIDLREQPEAEREGLLREAIAAYTRVRFDLAHGPLFRSYLFRLADDQSVYFTLRHNVIWDGWSFDVFLSELCTLYGAYEQQREPALPALTVTYGEYVIWQREFFESAELRRQTAWWRERLAGDPPELALPTDRPRPAKSSHAGDNASIQLTRAEADALTALGKSVGGTLFTALFAAFNVMLHRYSGQQEILVGTPVRARNRTEVEPLIGPFVNAVVLRSKLAPTQSFVELMREVRDVVLDALSHQDMPLEMLGARPPIVRAFFSLQDARTRPPLLGTLVVSQMHVEPPAAANDLMLWTMDTRDGLLAVINYSTELFDAATVRRFLSGFAELLRAVIVEPALALAALPIASPGELALVRSWGAPDGVEGSSLLERIEQTAATHPDRLALSEGSEALSYAQLLRRSSSVAALVRQRGITAGEPVGLLASSWTQRLVGLLGLTRAGATAVIIDPAQPAARNVKLTTGLSLELVLAAQGSEPPAGLARELLSFGAEEADPAHAADSATAGVLLYRFDEASRPQGLPVSFAGLSAGAAALAERLGLNAGDLVASLSQPSAELALLEALCALAAGATLLTPARDGRLPAGELRCLFGPTARLRELTANELRRIRALVYSDEPDADLLRRIHDGSARSSHRLLAFPEAGFAPLLGTLAAAPGEADGSQPNALPTNRLGVPFFPVRLAVVDSTGQSCPIGVPGVLQVGSALRADGELVPVSHLARFLADGSLELTRSLERSVDVLGHKLLLGEVEAVLAQHPGVAQVVVRRVTRRAGAAQLVAFFVAQPGQAYTESELRKHVRAQLPDYALPRTFVEIDAMPFTEQGRLDEPRLLGSLLREDDSDFVAARSDSEKLLVKLWSEELGLTRVSVHDNFFDVGGHSLLCFKLIAKLEQQTGKRLSPRVFLLGSLAQAAVELDALGGAQPVRAVTVPSPANRPGIEHSAARQGGLFQKLKGLIRRD